MAEPSHRQLHWPGGCTSTQLAVVGAGPAGICGALAAASYGVKVILVDRSASLGGQLVKQTHKFFGWHKKSAGTRGIVIAQQLKKAIEDNSNITFMGSTEVLGCYSDRTLLLETPSGIGLLSFDRLLVATGAAEKMLTFPGNDLPGVYGAGAVQTLMNVHGVRPGDRVVMVGSGNIGLIVSYQLVQAGVSVAAIVEAAKTIGGYAVHAAKIRRLGIPIVTGHSIKKVVGKGQVEEVIIWQLDDKWNGIPGTERRIEADVVCLATGLTPLAEILFQAGADIQYVPELGGHVPLCDEYMETTSSGVYAAGDVAGIEEASTAMAEGRLAGLSIARSLSALDDREFDRAYREVRQELDQLRAGPTGAKIRAGLSKAAALRQQYGKAMGGDPH